MVSDNNEQRCNLRTELIMEYLLLWSIDENDDISEETLPFDVLLSRLDDYFLTMQETEATDDSRFRTEFTEIAYRCLKLLYNENYPGSLEIIVKEKVIGEMEVCISEVLDQYSPDFIEINMEVDEEPLFYENIYHEHCVQCADIVWEECKFCIFNMETSDYIDSLIIDIMGSSFVDIINTACENAIDMMLDNVPSTICITFHDILQEIFEAMDTSMNAAEVSWELVTDEVTPIFEAKAAEINKQLCTEIDFNITHAYVDAVMALYTKQKQKFKDEMTTITEEVRHMEI
ncbi:unnamed protein product [Mucor hiemalis]